MTRAAPAAGPGGPAPDGLDLPLDGGRRSTTATGRAVLATAADAVDPRLAAEVRALPDWRSRYPEAVTGLLEATLASPAAAVAAARAGLAAVADRLVLTRGGTARPLADLDAVPAGPAPEVVTVRGAGRHPGRLVVPYRGEALAGDALRGQLDRWAAAGVVEPGCAAAVAEVVAHPEWLDLADVRVAALGAGAELAPTERLLAWGASVLGVDVPAPAVWRRLLPAAEAGSGCLEVPVRAGGDPRADLAERAGADLLADLPELLALLLPRARGLVLGSYLYADGGRHLLVNAAADALAARLAAAGAGALAALATPTAAFAVPEEVVAASRERLAAAGPAAGLLRRATGGRLLAPAYPRHVARGDGTRVGVIDALVLQQGPSYALAKTVQRWRATVARAGGTRASLVVAPMTRTRSVLQRRLLAAGYAGTPRFGVEVFAPETSRALTAALLVADLRSPTAAADPATALAHPEDLPAVTAAHGGLWRQPWAPRSVLPLAVLAGAPAGLRPR